jgi:nicotinate-nucleotide pyrophosphorylase (carboxylating)
MEITPAVRKLVALALEEDLAFGDITANLAVPEERVSRACVVARQRLVACGLPIVRAVVEAGGWSIRIDIRRREGELVENETPLLELEGSTRALLAAERTILNFLQRLCGVATFTHEVCAAAPGLIILDTRKTMPGWRYLDKYAVRTGGGKNHRFSLGDMILVKNNHIDGHPQGIRGVLGGVVAGKPPYMRWEVEVRNLEELQIAQEFFPDIIMLDNFSDDLIRQAVEKVKGRTPRPLLEVSGGVTKERLATLVTLGVDAVSIGALTTRAPNVDISMRIS